MALEKEIQSALVNVHDPDAEVRRSAVTVLRRFATVPQSTHALKGLVFDSEGDIRILAAEALARHGLCPEAAIPVLITVLEVADKARFARLPNTKQYRRIAAGALQYYGKAAAPAIPALTTALLDPDENVRGYAAMSLGAIGDAAIVALQDLRAARQAEESEHIRNVFDTAIRKIVGSDHFIVVRRDGHDPAEDDRGLFR